jgi:hypothetical protein
MPKPIHLICLLLFPLATPAQELFTYSEPASNMAAKSIGLRLENTLMRDGVSGNYEYQLLPSVMWGISKKLMVHVEGFFSNRNNSLAAEGGSVYAKYRLYSQDEVHSHFRMAALAKAAYNTSDILQPAIDLNGHNSGYELGLVATKLVNKVAVSAGSSWFHATDNGQSNKYPYKDAMRNAMGYNLVVGTLLLPKEYTSYDQVNVNAMMEFQGQANIQTGDSYIDLAPSLQFIFLSRMRLDFGYRFPLYDNLGRTARKGFLLRFEYSFFNVFK